MSARKQKVWIQLNEIQFEVSKQQFGEVGFIRAFKASNDNILFQDKDRVLRKYHESLMKTVGELEADYECQTRNAVQMHCLSKHLVFAFKQLCISNFNSFGQSYCHKTSITVYMVVGILQLRSTQLESSRDMSVVDDRYSVKE